MKTPFDIHKAAQAAHFFLSLSGSEMPILKLVKLIYLADRFSLEKRKTPIVGGSFYSLPHGPITSEVLNLINDGTMEGNSPWEQLITDRANHMVGTNQAVQEYDALAPSELRLREEIWNRFGSYNRWDLVRWTHQHCEEWVDPKGGALEISARKLAESFGWQEAETESFEAEMSAQCRLKELVS